MRSRRVYLALTVSLVLVAAACGGSDEGGGDENVNSATTTAAGTGQSNGDGTTTTSPPDDGDSAPQDLDPPENISIPLPNGGTLTASISDPANRYAYVSAEYSLGFDEIVAFYTDWAETDPRDWNGFDSSFDSQGTTVRAFLWSGPASRISVVECAGDRDAVCVEISDNDA